MNKVAVAATEEIASFLTSDVWMQGSETRRAAVTDRHETLSKLGFTSAELAAYALGVRFAAEQFILATQVPGASNEAFVEWLYLLSAMAANEALMGDVKAIDA